MDRANRAFLLLASASGAVYLLLGFWGCGALATVLTAVSGNGVAVLATDQGVAATALLAVLEISAAVLGIVSLNVQLTATRRLARWVRSHRVSVPDEVTSIVAEVGLRGRLDVVGTDELVCFTYGFLRPRVAISRAMLDVSTTQEVAAVLEHEAYHVRNLDPLKLVAARALPTAFFFMPALSELRDRYVFDRELAADRRAADRIGVPALAGALTKTLAAPDSFRPAAGAALGGTGALAARVEQLESGAEPTAQPLSKWRALATIASVLGLMVILTWSRWVVPGSGVHPHALPLGATATLASAMSTALCVAFWTWVVWHVASWRVARLN